MAPVLGVSLASWAIGLAAFVAMEPLTAATHRWVMHGIGERLHRSHHRAGRIAARWETNDWYPVIFAALVNVGFVVGFNVDGWGALVPAGIGVTAYGLAYGYVHDVYIHGRFTWLPRPRSALLDRLAEAHRVHHLYSAAPYGMLVPVVPAELRTRSQTTERDPFARA